MINIFICDDNISYQTFLKTTIDKILNHNSYEAHICGLYDMPDKLLHNIKPDYSHNLYFLDIEFPCEMNGIELATKIREIDHNCHIIFITTHDEMSPLTFKYKVEALGYISKDTPQNVEHEIKSCLDILFSRLPRDLNQSKKLTTYILGQKITVPYDDILYIEPSLTPHKVILHTPTKNIEIPSTMKAISEELPAIFFKCHKSCIVNINNIKSVDVPSQKLLMKNNSTCVCARRYASYIKKLIS